VTKKKDNLSTISHIIAYEADGPRGDADLSAKLRADISNLMLTCKKHGKIIDSYEHVKDYSVELLQEYKKEHEDRIRLLTGITENSKTHVLVFNAPINGKQFNFDPSEIYHAILPKYPANEYPHSIDLSDINIKEAKGNNDFLCNIIKKKYDSIFHTDANRRGFHHKSVFAIGPMPLLVYLGNLLGTIDHVDLFHKHRSTDKWTWKADETDEFPEEYYHLNLPSSINPASKVALAVSVSGVVDKANIAALLGDDCTVYEVEALKPGLDFLTSKEKLKAFGVAYRELLGIMRTANGHFNEIHLFCAAPPPVVIDCGRALLPKCDPPVKVYDFIGTEGGFTEALTINEHSKG